MPRSVAATDLSGRQVDDRENASEFIPLVAEGAWTRRRTSRKASRSQKQRRSAMAGSKQDLVLTLLRRQSGVSIADIVSKTHWQAHSVRGFLSAIVRKKLKFRLASEVGKDGVRRYHVAPLKVAEPRA